ncbi:MULTISPECIES: hypothetical protein [unclassified Microcoleus]|uniref:hypothetical protein n=1 Tax=unclassified Microcoleus TaxID=2642155 RepID=UPI0025FC31CD|nr:MULTISPECIES: hypothetical protein [unclassified Microcoleus]
MFHVDTEEYLLHLTRYIHLNPVCATNIVKKAEAWEFSSYQEYSGFYKDSRTLLGLGPLDFSGYVSCQPYLIFLRKAIY